MTRQSNDMAATEPLQFVSAIRSATRQCLDEIATQFDGRTRSWREVLDLAARIAGGLKAMGIEPGDRVAVLSSNSDDYLILYLAIPWAGAVLVPLNCRWSEAENRFAIDDCTPKLILVSDELAASNGQLFADGRMVVSLGAVRPNLDDMLAHAPIDDAGRGGDDLFAIFYTGGTTGRSKGVMLSHNGFVANCSAMRRAGLFPDGCKAVIVPPLFHLAAAAEMTMVMLAGGTAVIAAGFDAVAVLDLIADEDITDALLVPTMIQMILDAPGFDPAKLKSLRTIMYGASPMQESTLDRIMAAAPHTDFYQAYGMTELSCTATLLPPDHHKGVHRSAGRHRAAGHALANAEIMIVDADGHPLPSGAVGEILVRGRGVMLGYWNQPELTAEALRDGWMHTGDGGHLDEHGLLFVVDRLKDMIVTGGENVFSAEVESALASHPSVAQVAVIGVPDPRWGERVHAVVHLRADGDVSEVELIAYCRERIADYKCPRTIEVRPEPLPLSPAGKILKTELRRPYWQGTVRNVA